MQTLLLSVMPASHAYRTATSSWMNSTAKWRKSIPSVPKRKQIVILFFSFLYFIYIFLAQQLIVEKSTEIQKLREQVSQLEKKLEANEQQLTEKNNNVAQLLVKLAKKDKELEESRYESRKLGDHLIKRAEELKNCEAENAKLTEKLQIKLENERELREKLTQQMSIKFKGEALIRTLKGERDDYKEQLEKVNKKI